MTDDELARALADELEHGPLAALCDPYWHDTFQPPGERPAEITDERVEGSVAAWEAAAAIKRQRAGLLTPDAVAELAAILRPRLGQLADLGLQQELPTRDLAALLARAKEVTRG